MSSMHVSAKPSSTEALLPVSNDSVTITLTYEDGTRYEYINEKAAEKMKELGSLFAEYTQKEGYASLEFRELVAIDATGASKYLIEDPTVQKMRGLIAEILGWENHKLWDSFLAGGHAAANLEPSFSNLYKQEAPDGKAHEIYKKFHAALAGCREDVNKISDSEEKILGKQRRLGLIQAAEDKLNTVNLKAVHFALKNQKTYKERFNDAAKEFNLSPRSDRETIEDLVRLRSQDRKDYAIISERLKEIPLAKPTIREKAREWFYETFREKIEIKSGEHRSDTIERLLVVAAGSMKKAKKHYLFDDIFGKLDPEDLEAFRSNLK